LLDREVSLERLAEVVVRTPMLLLTPGFIGRDVDPAFVLSGKATGEITETGEESGSGPWGVAPMEWVQRSDKVRRTH
jgi:hypothetical protein